MTTLGLTPSPDIYDDAIPCLVVQIPSDHGRELLQPPVNPRTGPLVYVPEALEAISVEEMLEAQAADQWCQDLVRQIHDGHKTTRPRDYSLTKQERFAVHHLFMKTCLPAG
jgi:hypothetical protein